MHALRVNLYQALGTGCNKVSHRSYWNSRSLFRASRKSAPRTLWIALVCAPRQFVPRQDEKLAPSRCFPPHCTACIVRLQLSFFNFFRAVLFSFHSLFPFIRSRGMMRDRSPCCRSKNWPNFEGGWRERHFFAPPFFSFFKFGQFLSRGCAYSRNASPFSLRPRGEDRRCAWYRVFREFTAGKNRGVSRKGREDEVGKGWRSFFRRVGSTKTELQVVLLSSFSKILNFCP